MDRRIVWIDCMKVIGMYFITAGHFFPKGCEYIYVFSVQLFFAISGFLYKKENNNILFWKKLYHNLIIPMILFSIFNFVLIHFSDFSNANLKLDSCLKLLINLVVGNQGQDYNGVGLIAMWFVYTLCVLKIILQFIPSKHEHIVFIVLIMLCISGNIELHNHNVCIFNSWVNVLTALPFFLVGYYLRQYKIKLSFDKKIHKLSVLTLPFCIAIIYLCGKYNSFVYIYCAGYGKSYFLFILGGIVLVYIFSLFTEKFANQAFMKILGGGTIVLLGLQNFFMLVFDKLGVLHLNVFFDYMLPIVVLLICTPMITFLKKYFPIIYGTYRIDNKK